MRGIIRTLRAMIALTVLTVPGAYAQSSGPLIFDVRRSLPMEPNEPVYHDFYISAGPEAGFRKGMFVNTVRAIPVHDPVANKQQATLNVPTGRLQIIHVEKGLTIGRVESETSDDERPVVEYEAIMIGDRADLASLTTDTPKKKPKPKQVVSAPAPAAAPDSSVSAGVASGGPAPASVPPSVPESAGPAATQKKTQDSSLPAGSALVVPKLDGPSAKNEFRPTTVDDRSSLS